MVATSIPAGSSEPVMIERVTSCGRHLWYRLEVVQQPERARACGAGPKSSADRRPVDPPPVVELRIFEGPTVERSKDVTFTYNANFFLFATLEHARVIAHGRVQAPSASTPPVLTGMPVSGMAYLDRPQEAGYFLFPDLSVRHEGRYRLVFTLYEQTKEAADLDKDGADQPESFDCRMEIKSNDFTVYSAKKFPGLTESTALSRTVAEQGCRVRIRRDVRMRRREGKSGAAAAAAAAASSADAREEEYARRHRTQTPEVINEYRARSMSVESVTRTPYGPANTSRRPSVDYHHAAPSPQPGPSMPPAFPAAGAAAANSNHLRFAGQLPAYAPSSSSSVPPSPTYSTATHVSYTQHQQPPPLPSPQQQATPHAHHAPHHSASSFSGPSPSATPAPSQSPYYQDRPAPLSMPSSSPVVSAVPSPRRDSFSSAVDYRRMSANYTTAPPLAQTPLPSPSQAMPQPQPMAVDEERRGSTKTTLPPLSEMIASFGNQEQRPRSDSISHGSSHGSNHGSNHGGSHGSSISENNGAPSQSRVPSLSHLLLPQPVMTPSVTTSAPAANTAATIGKKRSYGQYNSLDTAKEAYQLDAAVKNHARQPEPTPLHDLEELWWKRADGTMWSARGEVQQPIA